MILRTPNADTWHETIRMIEDGDFRNSTELAAAVEDLGDNVAFLGKRFGGPVSADGVWYTIPIGSAVLGTVTNPPEWDEAQVPGSDALYPVMGLRTADGASTSVRHFFWLQLASFLPPAGLVRAVEVSLFGTGETLPAHTPQVTLYGFNVNTSERSVFMGPGQVNDGSDASSTVGEYTTPHTMGYNWLSGGQYESIDLSVFRSLMIKVESEYGAGASNGTYFYNVRCLVVKDRWTNG